ncbi:MAG: sensor histidine kinase [Thermoplasmatota archaeon]
MVPTQGVARAPPPHEPSNTGSGGSHTEAARAPEAAWLAALDAPRAPTSDAFHGEVARPLGPMADPPRTIVVPPPPGKKVPMDVVVAAEVLRRMNRTRQTVSLVSQVIIRSYEEEALHAEVCRHLVAFGGYLMAWVGIAESTPRKVVRPVAHAGLEPNFLSALKITWSNDLANRTPTSLAVQEQRPYVARNILQEPRFAVLREDAQLYGYTATCALPLQFAQYGMGVLTIHAMEPDAFNAEEVSLLRELANDLSAGIIGLRNNAQRQLLEARLASVVDAAADAIIGTDTQGNVTDWSAGATRLFGYQRGEVEGRPIGEFLLAHGHEPEEADVRDQIARGGRVERYETERRCKDGRIVATSVAVNPIFGGDGQIVGSTTVEHDITDRRAAATAARAVERQSAEVARLQGLETLRKEFINAASHELNTPLTPIHLRIKALEDSPDLTPELRKHVVVVARNVVRLAGVVRDMTEASRLVTGAVALCLTRVPLANVIEESVASFEEIAASAGIEIRAQVAPGLVGTADRERIGQVLYNFLTNAVRFTPRGGRIVVSAAPESRVIVVRVSDTGVGLKPADLDLLFQPFSRPHEPIATGPRGSGLGLFISKGIIEQHGGRIWAESDGPGKGSTFCFSLPSADEDRASIERLPDAPLADQEPAVVSAPPRVA